jgi:hypothetical protein
MYGFFLLPDRDCGVRIVFSMSAKFTVLRGVVRVAALLRLMAARVMSCSWRPELESAVRDETSFELRGVKKRVKRFGVMGGGRLGLRLPSDAVKAGGGDDAKSSGVGSWRRLRGAHGDDIMFLGVRMYSSSRAEIKEKHNWRCGRRHGTDGRNSRRAEVGEAHWPSLRGRASCRVKWVRSSS